MSLVSKQRAFLPHSPAAPGLFIAAQKAFSPTEQAGKPLEGPALVFMPCTKMSWASVGRMTTGTDAAPTASLGFACTSHLFRTETQKAKRKGDKPQHLLLTCSPGLLLSVLTLSSFHPKRCFGEGGPSTVLQHTLLPGLAGAHGSSRFSCSSRLWDLSWSFSCPPLAPVQIPVELMPGNRPLGYGQDPSMQSSSL